MTMKPHCDRCDALVDECQTWVEDNDVDGHDYIWHFHITAGGSVYADEKMFCRACRMAILEAYVKELKGEQHG
jgi:hypothetical protein